MQYKREVKYEIKASIGPEYFRIWKNTVGWVHLETHENYQHWLFGNCRRRIHFSVTPEDAKKLGELLIKSSEDEYEAPAKDKAPKEQSDEQS